MDDEWRCAQMYVSGSGRWLDFCGGDVDGDMDGDTDYDLVTTAYMDDRLAWFENDCAGQPTHRPSISTDDARTKVLERAGGADRRGGSRVRRSRERAPRVSRGRTDRPNRGSTAARSAARAPS